MEAKYSEYPLVTLSLPSGGNSVVVGNTHGEIAILDLRKGLVRGCLKGLAGGVRSLQCHPSLPLVASCGLDRFLRIHSLEDRKLLHKVYLKSRLNCLLLASRDPQDGGNVSKTAVTGEVKEEDGEVWDILEKVGEEEEEGDDDDVEEEEEGPKRKKTEGVEALQKKSKKKRKNAKD